MLYLIRFIWWFLLLFLLIGSVLFLFKGSIYGLIMGIFGLTIIYNEFDDCSITKAIFS